MAWNMTIRDSSTDLLHYEPIEQQDGGRLLPLPLRATEQEAEAAAQQIIDDYNRHRKRGQPVLELKNVFFDRSNMIGGFDYGKA
nr:MAG TPA_asm: hypothetical protein [Caudoviricetes sp.]